MRRICKHDLNMADESVFYGTWKIVECVSLAGTVEPTGIEGTVFQLDENGDISWKVCDDAESMPFFSCETYEVSLGNPAILKLFATFAGSIIAFRVEVSEDLMLLTYERCCMLQCQRIESPEHSEDLTFSFLGALEEGYFSDLVITANSGKEFRVHKIILGLAVPSIDWESTPPPLSGLPEEVVSTCLHYLYAECLPDGLSEDVALACIKAVHKMRGFERFEQLCQTFIKNTALRQQISNLVEDMHRCADNVIDLFSGKLAVTTDSHVGQNSLITNPARLCYVVKQAMREAAVAGVKLLILCDLFSRRKAELSRDERHKIIKYAKSRLPIFMNQLRRFLEVCKQHSSSVTATERHEIATYLVPEIESALDVISTVIVEMRIALEHVICESSAATSGEKHEKHKPKQNMRDILSRSLRNALHMRELLKLKAFNEKMTHTFHNLMQKKENFSLMTQDEKSRSVAKNLEQLIDEVPLFLVRIEELMSALDEKVTWREWKYLFKLGTSKVAWSLNKVQSHRNTLSSLISKLCDMVSRDQFTQSLAMLNLSSTVANCNVESSKPAPKYAQLSTIESLCSSPYVQDSTLAVRSLELLMSGDKTDMVFEIIVVQESGDVVIDHSQGEATVRHDHQKEVDIHLVRGHCVVIAARCHWFCRALLSGMREAIDKKITVHDTNPDLFRVFLGYLYSGQLTSELTVEQLADLMTLSDRYEVESLKTRCEHALKMHITDDSALFLLSLADQFHAKTLRSCAMNFLLEHPSLVDSEVFEELPEHLQTEIEEQMWRGIAPPRSLAMNTDAPDSLSSLNDRDDLTSPGGLDLAAMGRCLGNESPSSSPDDHLEQYVEDSERLESCITHLRSIIGDSASHDQLTRVALAADFDINRALNFFFS